MAQIEIHGTCDDRFLSLKEIFAEHFDKGLEVGASLAVTLNGELVVDIWGGFMDEARTKPWEKDTIVTVWSTTKVMTALSLHLLVDRGLIDLDSPVSKYWPEFAENGKENIPVRYLLSHTSGLAGFDEEVSVIDLYNWDKMTTILASQKPWWKPGSRSGYHSVAFGFLVGELVRRVSGKSLGTFFRDEIARPLNIDFHIGLAAENDGRVAELVRNGKMLPNWLKKIMMLIAPTTTKVFFNPDPVNFIPQTKLREFRAAEIPSSNGHGNARSIAKVGSILANGGIYDGKQILSLKTIENSIEEQINNKDLVNHGKMRWGLGYSLESGKHSIGNKTFQWGGWGGSTCIMDLDKKASMGYAMNKMGSELKPENRATDFAQELRKILDKIL